jgi:hypothetical protein
MIVQFAGRQVKTIGAVVLQSSGQDHAANQTLSP